MHVSFLIQSHPSVVAWRNKIINYDKLVVVFEKDVANGQFVVPSGSFYMNSEQGSAGSFQSMGDDMSFHVDEAVEDFSAMDNRAESSARSRGSRRRGQANDDMVGALCESSEKLSNAILQAADKMADPSRKMVADVFVELRAITELPPIDVENAHEWLTLHKDMAHIFLLTYNKNDWILRRLTRIRGDNLFGY